MKTTRRLGVTGNRIYGFYDECKRRYSIKLWKIFSDVFNCLPVSALVEEKILCMHGGLSPELNNAKVSPETQLFVRSATPIVRIPKVGDRFRAVYDRENEMKDNFLGFVHHGWYVKRDVVTCTFINLVSFVSH